jgi:putative DNA primase/helicase
MTKPALNTVTRAEFIERRPEHLRDFYAALLDELPPEFSISTAGIKHRSGANRSTPFCTLFRVKAMVRTQKSKLWSRVVELIDPGGELVECILSAGTITGKPRDAVAKLSDHGLQVYNDYQLRAIAQLLRNWPVPSESRLTLIDKVGWTEDKDAFILTSGRVLTCPEAPKKYQFGGDRNGEELGSLPQWREGVATLAKRNINMAFGISLGFSTALVPLTNLNTLIFHIFRRTSQGKTLVLRTGLSVWPQVGEKIKTWEGTGNGLEGEIAKSHSILLGLDELRAEATPELPEVVYKFGNSSTKARGKKEGGAEDRKNWETNVFSAGEYSFVETLKQLGATATGGQRVRMLDIPAKGEYGVFDFLHGFDTSDAFVSQLENALDEASGPPGIEFVERLLEMTKDDLKKALDKDHTAHTQALNEHLGIVSGDDKTSEIRRVIKSFALISTAGEWATRWGLTGWKPGTASEAVKTIAHRWLDEYLRMPAHHSEELEKVRDFIVENEARFIKLVSGPVVPSQDTLGYQDDEFFYILPPTFVGLTKEKNKTLNALTDSGYLEKGGENKSLQTRLPSAVPRRPRAYRIRRSILEFQNNTETTTEVRRKVTHDRSHA